MNNQNVITTLKGPDRIRLRPNVIFGADGTEGATNAVIGLIKIFIAHGAQGKSSKIKVSIDCDDLITIKSFDDGFILSEKLIDGKPEWHYHFCQIHPCEIKNFSSPSNNSEYVDIYGQTTRYTEIDSDPFFDLACLQCVSKTMQVTVLRDGFIKKLGFEKGYPICELSKEPAQNGSYTEISLIPDSGVFGTSKISSQRLYDLLQIAAITIPTIECEYENKAENRVVCFKYSNGIADYLKEIAGTDLFPYQKEICAVGKDRYNQKEYSARVKVALGFVKSNGTIKCIHNHKELVGGGHLKILKEQIVKYISWGYDIDKTFDDISDKMIIIIESNCDNSATRYENPRETSICNRMLCDMTGDTIGEDFRHYLKKQKETILNVI